MIHAIADCCDALTDKGVNEHQNKAIHSLGTVMVH